MPLSWPEVGARRAGTFPRAAKTAVAVVVDAIAAPLLLVLALTLRRGGFAEAMETWSWLFVSAVLTTVAAFARFGVYRAVVRFLPHAGVATALLASMCGAAFLALVNYWLAPTAISANSLTIFCALLTLYLVVSRSAVLALLQPTKKGAERVVIYGAGASGVQLARALRSSQQYVPVGFIDDDISLAGKLVTGLKVYRPGFLDALVHREQVKSVLLALPSTRRARRQAILKSLEHLPVHVRTVPDLCDIASGSATVTSLREVGANDLLGRDPIAPNERLLSASITGKVVMVSGAGGSIGSELCRQIVRRAPARLVLLEISEAALYQIEQQLRVILAEHSYEVDVVALLGDALKQPRMTEIMKTYGVQTFYHAAAYKHVPIVEQNIVEGIHNNIFTTCAAAEAALESRVETFVLVSTDKAVNPTNVMGATKRLAELVLQGIQQRSTFTRFCMVRFGNVLESSGSVVPLFREQIKRGGPVTVTHKEITRYFMTIPEASQLVLQAGSMAQGGDVFVLDMGEPVRIDDLARRMIRLMGLAVRDMDNPEGDIEIVYTGLRPAEKLFEELLIGNNVTGSEHPMIMRAMEHSLPWTTINEVLSELKDALSIFDCGAARAILAKTVSEYRPISGIQDLVWSKVRSAGETGLNVSDIRAHRARLARSDSEQPRLA